VSWVQTVWEGGPERVTFGEKPAHNGEALQVYRPDAEGNPVGRRKLWMTLYAPVARKVESYQALNYSKKCRYRAEDVRRFLSSKGWLLPP